MSNVASPDSGTKRENGSVQNLSHIDKKLGSD